MTRGVAWHWEDLAKYCFIYAQAKMIDDDPRPARLDLGLVAIICMQPFEINFDKCH